MSKEEGGETMDGSVGNSEAPEESQVSNVILWHPVEPSRSYEEIIEPMCEQQIADFLRKVRNLTTFYPINAMDRLMWKRKSVTEEEFRNYFTTLYWIRASDTISGTNCVPGIDIANDTLYGGLEAIHEVLCLPHEGLQLRAAVIVGDCMKNNPIAQQCVLRVPRLLPDLIKLIDTASSQNVKLKALYAVSCIVRDNPSVIGVFHRHKGFETLKKMLAKDEDTRMLIEASYLVIALSGQDKQIKDRFVDLGYVQHLISLTESDQIRNDHEVLEAVIVALHSLVENNERALEILKSSDKVKPRLRQIINKTYWGMKGNEAYLELRRYATDLLKMYESMT